MAMSCPIRKEAIRKKREALNNKRASDEVKKNNESNISQLNHDIIYRSISLLFPSAMKNHENPGTFSSELNELYRVNNIPAVNLDGFVPPGLVVLNLHRENFVKLKNSKDTDEIEIVQISSANELDSKNKTQPPVVDDLSSVISSVGRGAEKNIAVADLSEDSLSVSHRWSSSEIWKNVKVYKFFPS